MIILGVILTCIGIMMLPGDITTTNVEKASYIFLLFGVAIMIFGSIESAENETKNSVNEP